ncbi:MAG: hypothetical protein NT027_14125 [Proteobacteria bacterium]|nr:hypothetical protein [Pseudomonadota bacterium]
MINPHELTVLSQEKKGTLSVTLADSKGPSASNGQSIVSKKAYFTDPVIGISKKIRYGQNIASNFM